MKKQINPQGLFKQPMPIMSREAAYHLMSSNTLSDHDMAEMSRVLACFDVGIHELSNGMKINATKDRLLGGGFISDIGGKLWDFAKDRVAGACHAAANAGWNALLGKEAPKNEQEKDKQLAEMESKYAQLEKEQQQKMNAQLETIKGLIPSKSAKTDPETDADNAVQLNLAAKKLKAVDLPGLTQHISAQMRDLTSTSSTTFNGEFKGQVNSGVQTVTNGNFSFN